MLTKTHFLNTVQDPSRGDARRNLIVMSVGLQDASVVTRNKEGRELPNTSFLT